MIKYPEKLRIKRIRSNKGCEIKTSSNIIRKREKVLERGYIYLSILVERQDQAQTRTQTPYPDEAVKRSEKNNCVRGEDKGIQRSREVLRQPVSKKDVSFSPIVNILLYYFNFSKYIIIIEKYRVY